MNIYQEYEYISLWLCLPGKYFKLKIYKSQEKEIFRHYLKKKYIYQVFVNYSWILPIWQILFLFLFASFGVRKLFLFLFVQKLAPQNYSYSYLREKLLFADHCPGYTGSVNYILDSWWSVFFCLLYCLDINKIIHKSLIKSTWDCPYT